VRIHYIRHISFEKVGIIEEWANQRNYSLTETKTYKGDLLPSVDDFDALIIMGGPQSAAELEKYPYLRYELELIKSTIEANKPLLGICLGAQLISRALGAKVSKSAEKEIGVFPIELTEEGSNSKAFSGFKHKFPAIHWHSDTFDIAKGARLLASSKGCKNQAFSYGKNVHGVQFHLEMTKPILKDLIAHFPEDLKPSKYTQSIEKMLEHDIEGINKQLFLLLDNIMKLD